MGKVLRRGLVVARALDRLRGPALSLAEALSPSKTEGALGSFVVAGSGLRLAAVPGSCTVAAPVAGAQSCVGSQPPEKQCTSEL